MSEVFDPFDDIEYVPFPAEIVNFVDTLLAYKNRFGSRFERIESEADWKILEKAFEGWSILYPEDYRNFLSSQKKIKSGLRNKHGSAREGHAEIQHQLEIPVTFYKLINTLFPKQEFEKTFIKKFVTRLPMFKVPESRL